MKIKQFNIYMMSCFLFAFVKIWLIAQNEIVAMPYDPEAYIWRTMNGFWKMGAVHSGYPIWLYLIKQIGFPQRISIEILYLASCFFVSTTAKAYTHYIAATLMFFVLVFAPFTYFLFDQALSDGFYLCLTLFALGFSLKLLSFPKLKIRAIAFYASGLGVTLGIMLITRSEDQLIFFWIFAVTALFTVFSRVRDNKVLTINFWQRPCCLFFITSIASFLIINIICTVFYVNSGVFARSYTLLPGHYKLLKNLSMIDSGIPQKRYIPISSASRKLAYAVSPTLISLRDEVENINNINQTASRLAGLPKGEIGAGWIWWVFLSVISSTIPNPNPVTFEEIFMKINDELDAAFLDGRLKKRFIINPLIGGNIPQLLSGWPSGVLTVLGKVFSSYPYVKSDIISNSKIFNKVCLRRIELIGQPNHIVLQGWAFVDPPQLKILSVSPRTVDGKYGKATYMERVDVSNGFEKSNGWRPEVYGFRAEIESNSLEDVKLTYFLSDGTAVDSNLFSEGQVTTIENNANNNSKILQGIDIAELELTNVRSGIRHEIQKTLARYMRSNASVLLASAISIAFIILAVIKGINKKYDTFRNVFVFQLLLLLLFGARIFFYSLIETASWNVEIRYLASAQALFFIFISFSLVAIITSSTEA